MDTGLLRTVTFRWENNDYAVKPEGLFSSTLLLLEAGVRIGAAEPDGFFSSAFRLYLPCGRYILKPRFSLAGRYDCLIGEKLAGSIRCRGMFKRGYEVDLPANWSFPEQAFAIAVVRVADLASSSG